MIALYRDLGVRQIHLAYNRNNSVADGCHDVERGLTPLGRRIVAAVNDAGLLMDCSHTGRRCSLDIMGASARPVIFSHSNPLALVEHGRNVTDEQIRACAATGGVVCVSGVSMFVGSRTPTAEDVARHAAYVAELVGVEHAGIGLDISFRQDGIDETPPGPYDPDYWWPRSAGYDRATRAQHAIRRSRPGTTRRRARAHRHDRRRGGPGDGRQHGARREPRVASVLRPAIGGPPRSQVESQRTSQTPSP